MKRTLSLKRESLSELTAAQLASVAGGDAPPTWYLKECLQDVFDTWQPTRCACPY